MTGARPDAVYHLAAQASVGVVVVGRRPHLRGQCHRHAQRPRGGPALPAPTPGAAGQLGRGVRRGRARRAAGGRNGRSARSAPTRPARRPPSSSGCRRTSAPGSRSSGPGPSTTPARASAQTSWSPRWPARSPRRPRPGRRAAGRQPRRRGGTSPMSATWCGPTGCSSSGATRARSTTSAPGGRSRSRTLARRLLALAGVELSLQVDPARVRAGRRARHAGRPVTPAGRDRLGADGRSRPDARRRPGLLARRRNPPGLTARGPGRPPPAQSTPTSLRTWVSASLASRRAERTRSLAGSGRRPSSSSSRPSISWRTGCSRSSTVLSRPANWSRASSSWALTAARCPRPASASSAGGPGPSGSR